MHANLRRINARQQGLIRHLEHRKIALQGAQTESYELRGKIQAINREGSEGLSHSDM